MTGVFMMALVTEATALLVFTSDSQRRFAISLLTTPLGVLACWRLSKLNRRGGSGNFPVGTYVANMLAIALNGSLGAFLGGQGTTGRERIVLQSIIDGFGGSLSTLTRFLIEVLNGIDPVAGRSEGLSYLGATLLSGLVIGFVTRQATDWVDTVEPDETG
mmetsp:Transcript_12389/g.24681  ORF Transcript_12389/g.24681 Transcript_12389/m.24681 type:complete len:160 (-) Transcript_12389:207-686(-)